MMETAIAIARKITPSGGTASTRYYSYDTGGNIVSEYKSDASGQSPVVRYIRDNSGKAISMLQGSNTYYFTYNAHGDVTGLTDSTPPTSGLGNNHSVFSPYSDAELFNKS